MLKIFRVLLAGGIFLGGSLILGVISIFRPFHYSLALLFTRIFPPLTMRAFGIDLEIRHQERMHQTHPCIYIANHQHALDVPAFGTIICRPTVAIGKKELIWVPFFGWLLWITGQILINRKHNRSAVETMKEAADIVKQKQLAVFLFPEGTRSGTKPLQKFKKGAFYLAIQAQVPLLPIVVNSYHKSIDLNRWHPGRVIIEVLPPISTQGYSLNDIEELVNKSHKIMAEAIDRLDNELSQKNLET